MGVVCDDDVDVVIVPPLVQELQSQAQLLSFYTGMSHQSQAAGSCASYARYAVVLRTRVTLAL